MLADGVQVGDIFMLHRGDTVKEYYIVVSRKLDGNYGLEPSWSLYPLQGEDDGSWETESALLDRDYYRKVA